MQPKFLSLPPLFLNLGSIHLIAQRLPVLCGCTTEKIPRITVTQIHVTLPQHLSQPSSKLSQLFINMKLCLSQVEQCDFLLRRADTVLALLQGHCHFFANFSADTYCSGFRFPLIVGRGLICPNTETIYVIQKTGINNKLCMTESKEFFFLKKGGNL